MLISLSREEVEEEVYDFASGVLKSWWRKYHA